jgi:DNA-binding MarR family transcriptional regulator
MERDGWISRRACPNDRRKRLISPTPRAKPVWEQGAACAVIMRQRNGPTVSQPLSN